MQYIKTKAVEINDWVKSNRLEVVILLFILIVASFLRLYRISEYMTFLGDEGRDVIVVRRLLVDFDPILVGPGTSIGNMYLGPLYYYMMAPALLFANFSPVGPAVMIALLGVATVFLTWYVAREWFCSGDKICLAAVIASSLYAISPVVITYSRSSWNPNIMPFFALLSIYSIWNVWQENSIAWLVVISLSMAAVLQSHYLGLLLIPVLGIFWLLTFIKVKGKEKLRKSFLKHTGVSALVFVLLMSPLFIFDARHGWRNMEAMRKFFLERQTTVSARPWTALPKVPELWTQMTTRLVTATDEGLGRVYALIIPALTIVILLLIFNRLKKEKMKKSMSLRAFMIILSWLSLALIGFGVYKQHIYDHYFGFVYAAPFLLIGGISQVLYDSAKKHYKIPVVIILLIIFYFPISHSLKNSPINFPPNRQLQRTISVSEKISEEAGNNKFNIAVIAERNYEGAYQYYLEMWGTPIVAIDPQRADDTIADQLFVVCELPPEKCDPVNNPKAEIANFGWSKVGNSWQVAGTTIYKLIPNRPDP